MAGLQTTVKKPHAGICTRWFFLPGFDGTGLLFEPIKAALQDAAPSVVCYPNQTPQTYESLVQLVSAALPCDVPYILIAESFSGPIAIQAAALARLRPHALILCASFATCPLGPILGMVARLGSRLLFQVRPPEWFIRRYLVGEDAPKKLIEDFYRALGAVSVPVLEARLDSILQVNVLRDLAALSVPVLYIRGSQDRLVKAESLRIIQNFCPGVQIETVNAPHLILQRAPERCVELIRRFLLKKFAIAS